MTCTRCGGTGLLPWSKLDGLLYCRGCRSWFRLDNSARLVEAPSPYRRINRVTAAGPSGWQRSLGELWRGWAESLLTTLAAWGRRPKALACCAAGLVALAAALMFWHRGPGPAVAGPPLPAALEQRAVLMADAWLAKDLSRMLRLTDASRDRQLRRWLSYTPPPTGSRNRGAKASKIEVVSVRQRPQGMAEVSLQLSMADPIQADMKLPLKQTWLNRTGEWFFIPGTIAAQPR
jgi:hypothetical protein